jgi:hypothetical protein
MNMGRRTGGLTGFWRALPPGNVVTILINSMTRIFQMPVLFLKINERTTSYILLKR